jgi:hypothetical protein
LEVPAFLIVGGNLLSTRKEKPARVKVSPMLKVSMRLRLSETPEYSRSLPGPVVVCIALNGFNHSISANFRHYEYMSEPPEFWVVHQTPRTPLGFVDFKDGFAPTWSPCTKPFFSDLQATPMNKAGAPRLRVEHSG